MAHKRQTPGSLKKKACILGSAVDVHIPRESMHSLTTSKEPKEAYYSHHDASPPTISAMPVSVWAQHSYLAEWRSSVRASVHVRLTVRSTVANRAVTHISIDHVAACGGILARVAPALINVYTSKVLHLVALAAH